jgi:NADPH2:quinone reductase
VEAVAIPETYFTVWVNVFERANLQEGESILIQGGSSGIGVAAVQLSKALRRATVFVTAGSDDKCAACLRLGADHAINYRTQDFVEEIRRVHPRGIDVALDMVAGPYLSRELDIMADDGRISVIASLGGAVSQFEVWKLMRKRVTLTGSTLRPRSVEFKTHVAQQLRQHVWPLFERAEADGGLRPVIHSTFAAGAARPDGATKAHQLMESSAHVGKIVLTWE